MNRHSAHCWSMIGFPCSCPEHDRQQQVRAKALAEAARFAVRRGLFPTRSTRDIIMTTSDQNAGGELDRARLEAAVAYLSTQPVGASVRYDQLEAAIRTYLVTAPTAPPPPAPNSGLVEALERAAERLSIEGSVKSYGVEGRLLRSKISEIAGDLFVALVLWADAKGEG